VNGTLMAETQHKKPGTSVLSGVLALQLRSGPPTIAQFKNIRLKRLKLIDGRKKIVMVAGKPSHGPGEHEYNAGCALLKKCLDASGLPVRTALYRDGWPADATAFDNADAVMLYMNGGPKHPIMGRNRLAEIDALMKEGVGLVCAHFAVEVPAEKGGPAYQDWIGGYYESGFSTNPHWTAKVELDPSHPITRGVKPFEMKDEWYFNMRFRPNNAGVVSILRATPNEETRRGGTSYPRGPYPHIVEAKGRSETLMWAVERKDGGRGVGFTGGHFHSNWQNDNVRKLRLNALLWAAKAEVPAEGVQSTVSAEAMRQNLDAK
jgi:type 1 glutamine amidotransferase